MKVIIICSGGLDSVSMALRYIGKDDVLLMTFDYGQKAKDEMLVVSRLSEKYGVPIMKIDLSGIHSIFGKDNQLTNDVVSVKETYEKSIVVPLRNALFLQVAMIYAYSHGYDKVVLGSHLDDCVPVDGEYAFPDCSPEFFKAFELAMDLGTFRSDKKVSVESASRIGLHKTDLIRFAMEKDAEIVAKTWSCYHSGERQCGKCDSCRNRKAAFVAAGIEDPTEYEND